MAAKIRTQKTGFSLMEIVVALTVITVIAMVFLGSSAHAKRVSAMAQQKMVAVQLIDKKFSLIKVDNGKTLVLGSTSEPILELRNGVMILDVTRAQPDNVDDLKQVVATVKWDFPWRDQTGRCDAAGDQTCDRQESAVTIFYTGY